MAETLYAQNNCSIWCWWKTVEVEVYEITKMFVVHFKHYPSNYDVIMTS